LTFRSFFIETASTSSVESMQTKVTTFLDRNYNWISVGNWSLSCKYYISDHTRSKVIDYTSWTLCLSHLQRDRIDALHHDKMLSFYTIEDTFFPDTYFIVNTNDHQFVSGDKEWAKIIDKWMTSSCYGQRQTLSVEVWFTH
jgi:hypothetical protein